MKISASVYSSVSKPLRELVLELDAVHIDYFHIDCKNDLSVFDDIRLIRTESKTPIDLHIISSEPEKFFQPIEEHQVECVTFQYENLTGKFPEVQFGNTELGLAIGSETNIDVFEEFKNQFDFVLFMTTTPGESGGVFNKNTFKKIRAFRSKYPDKKIHVDGGVNADISFVLRNMGVYAVVSGSYLVNASYMSNALHNMRSDYYVPNQTKVLVKDVMLSNGEIPRLEENSITLEKVLRSIDEFNLGFTLVTDKEGKLTGLISNADLRKGFIRNISDLNAVDVSGIINRNPAKVYDDFTIDEMLAYIKNTKFNILYLPVVDRNNILTGTVTFTNLIKGE